MFHRTILIVALGAWVPVFAQSATPQLEAVPEPPPIPEQLQSGGVMVPDVRIVRKDQSTITEYRVNGRLRAIKVTPDGDFPAYYLYDTDGDGRLDQRCSGYEPDLLIPNWVIFSW